MSCNRNAATYDRCNVWMRVGRFLRTSDKTWILCVWFRLRLGDSRRDGRSVYKYRRPIQNDHKLNDTFSKLSSDQGYIPALRDAKIVRSWCGWLDEAFDGVPFLSPVEEAPGLILACGFTGHGFGTAPAVGLMLSQMVRGEKTVVDISALRYDRFKPCR